MHVQLPARKTQSTTPSLTVPFRLAPMGRIVQLPSIDPCDYVWMSTFVDAQHLFLEHMVTRRLSVVPVVSRYSALKSLLCKEQIVLLCYPLPRAGDPQYMVIDAIEHKTGRSVYERVAAESQTVCPEGLLWVTDYPSFTYTSAAQRECMARALERSSMVADAMGKPLWSSWHWVDYTWEEAKQPLEEGPPASPALWCQTVWMVHSLEWSKGGSSVAVRCSWPKHASQITRDDFPNDKTSKSWSDWIVDDADRSRWIKACLLSLEECLEQWIATKQPPSESDIRRMQSLDDSLLLAAVLDLIRQPNPSTRAQLTEWYGTTDAQRKLSPLARDLYAGWIEREWTKIDSILVRTLYRLLHSKDT